MSRLRAWHGVAAPAPPTHYRRLAVMTGLLLAAFGLLAVRLVDIQVFRAPELRSEVQRILLRTQVFTPRRGEIRDRNGEVLARSELVKEVKADPSLVGAQHARFLAGYLADPLEMELEELVRLLSSDTRLNERNEPVPRKYVRLKRGVTAEQYAQVRSNLATLDSRRDYPGLRADGAEVPKKKKQQLLRGFQRSIQVEPYDEQIRVYPRGRLASHVLGFVGPDPRLETNSPYATLGREGLERSMNPILEGVGGWRVLRAKRSGRQTIEQDLELFRPRPGQHVVLTLDATLQAMVEEALAAAWRTLTPEGISAVVVVPRTGEVLAMANLPDFDPADVRSARDYRRRNRAITDPFAPGSTAKVITFGLGLDAGVIRLDDLIDCHMGFFRHASARVRDPTPLGVVSLRTALAQSSNIAASKTGIGLTEARLHEGFARFGIGQRTGIPLPAESGGRLRPLAEWNPGYSVTSVSYGYELTATPLQMTMAVAAVANEGRLMRPLLVKRIENDQGSGWEPFGPEVRGQAISPEAARQLVSGLRAVVEEGTGRRASLPDYVVAGKTGTANKWQEDQRRWGDYPFSSFVGFFPAEDPVLCIGVFVDEPKVAVRGGAATAAPLFREIAARAAVYLGIPPSPPEVMGGHNLAREAGAVPLTLGRERSRM